MLTDILAIWTPDNGDGYALVTDLAAFADTVEAAILAPPYIRITGSNDATPSSTDHPLQIGPTSGQNLIIDNNEIMARNGGAENGLGLNLDGGNVGIGNNQSIVTIPGRINSTHYAWAQSAGKYSFGSVAGADSSTVTISFPGGRFTQPPVVTVSPQSTAPQLRQVSPSNVTTTSFDLTYYNAGSSATGVNVHWNAVQMTSSNASG